MTAITDEHIFQRFTSILIRLMQIVLVFFPTIMLIAVLKKKHTHTQAIVVLRLVLTMPFSVQDDFQD